VTGGLVRRVARNALILVIAELFTGVVIGLGARSAMRVVALMDDSPGTSFTVGGTAGIVVAVAVAGTVPALVFMAIRRSFTRSDLARGMLFGGCLALVGLPLAAGEAFQIGNPLVNVAMFGALFVAYGILLSLLVGRLDRRFVPAPVGAS
jgi:hypothetical protein